MDWLAVIGLISVGVFLIVAEILFIPGIFIAGTAGVVLSIWGVYISYDTFGSTAGTITLVIAAAANIGAFVLALRGKTWQKFSLKESHTSRTNKNPIDLVKIGDVGKSLSVLKPVGKALFSEKEVEVYSKGNYIAENVDVEIISIDSNKIIVQEINN